MCSASRCPAASSHVLSRPHAAHCCSAWSLAWHARLRSSSQQKQSCHVHYTVPGAEVQLQSMCARSNADLAGHMTMCSRGPAKGQMLVAAACLTRSERLRPLRSHHKLWLRLFGGAAGLAVHACPVQPPPPGPGRQQSSTCGAGHLAHRHSFLGSCSGQSAGSAAFSQTHGPEVHPNMDVSAKPSPSASGPLHTLSELQSGWVLGSCVEH